MQLNWSLISIAYWKSAAATWVHKPHAQQCAKGKSVLLKTFHFTVMSSNTALFTGYICVQQQVIASIPDGMTPHIASFVSHNQSLISINFLGPLCKHDRPRSTKWSAQRLGCWTVYFGTKFGMQVHFSKGNKVRMGGIWKLIILKVS